MKERKCVFQEKEFQKLITKKECFFKIYPIKEAPKLSEGSTKKLLPTSDKTEIRAFEIDGVTA